MRSMFASLITVTQDPGTSGARKLLNVPVYDFDDQGARIIRVAREAGLV